MNQNNWNESEIKEETLDTLNSETKQTQPTNPEPNQGGWMDTVARGLAAAPILLEQFTGKKLPLVGGTLGEIQQTLSQLAFSWQQNFDKLNEGLGKVINNQLKIFNRINSLESNASRRLLNLDQRIQNLGGIKLTYEKERKQVECNNNSALEQAKFNNFDRSSENEQY